MSDTTKGLCFVVMGFGKKTDFETGRTLDLDKTYRNIIKPAVSAAGLECVRADEIVHSGIIDGPMYEQLLKADVVIVDLSTWNKNALYELGVRHALRPATTIVIAEDGLRYFPFDANTLLVRQYRHQGEGIDYDEVERFRQVLTAAITEILSQEPRPVDSPVYHFLPGLNPPAMSPPQPGQGEGGARGGPTERGGRGTGPTTPSGDAAAELSPTYSALMQDAANAQSRADFISAKSLLGFLRRRMSADTPGRPEDPYVIQQLALVTYKSKQPTPEAALLEARDILVSIEPETSNDPETLGLWATVNKRLWDLTSERACLDDAVRGYERAFYLRNDYYNGINLAFLLNVRAADAHGRARAAEVPEESTAALAEAVTDFVQARRVRREVVSICRRWLDSRPTPEGLERADATKEERYWVLAALAEAHLGLGDETGAKLALNEAQPLALAPWMLFSSESQLDKLRGLIKDSPLDSLGKVGRSA